MRGIGIIVYDLGNRVQRIEEEMRLQLQYEQLTLYITQHAFEMKRDQLGLAHARRQPVIEGAHADLDDRLGL